jgi:hypothetical protein
MRAQKTITSTARSTRPRRKLIRVGIDNALHRVLNLCHALFPRFEQFDLARVVALLIDVQHRLNPHRPEIGNRVIELRGANRPLLKVERIGFFEPTQLPSQCRSALDHRLNFVDHSQIENLLNTPKTFAYRTSILRVCA